MNKQQLKILELQILKDIEDVKKELSKDKEIASFIGCKASENYRYLRHRCDMDDINRGFWSVGYIVALDNVLERIEALIN